MDDTIDREPTEEEMAMVRRIARAVAPRWRVDPADAESDGMLGLARGLRRLEDNGNRSHFLAQKIRWSIFDGMRQRLRRHHGVEVAWPGSEDGSGEWVPMDVPDASTLPRPEVVGDGDSEMLSRVMSAFPPKWRVAFMLQAEGMTRRESCRLAGVPEVRQEKEIARACLKAGIDPVVVARKRLNK